MLREFLDGLVDLAKNNNETTIKMLPGDRNAILNLPDGCWQEVKVPPSRIKHDVETYDDFVQAVTEFATNGVVFVDQTGAILLIDREDRRDFVTWRFDLADAFSTVANLESGRAFNQTEFHRFLKHDLHGSGVDGLLPAVRTVEFKRNSDGKATVEHGREALGRQVEATIQGSADIPEHLSPRLRVFRQCEQTQLVHCSLELNVVGESFVLRPYPDQVQLCIDAVIREVIQDLRNELKTPVFSGNP